jgi:hypothetical protein
VKRPLFLIVLCLVLILTVGAAAVPAQRADACDWGASSMRAEVVEGQVVESEPATSGCIP